MLSPFSGSKKQVASTACYLFHAGFLLGLLFDPENGGHMLLRNVGWFQRTTRRYVSEDRTLPRYKDWHGEMASLLLHHSEGKNIQSHVWALGTYRQYVRHDCVSTAAPFDSPTHVVHCHSYANQRQNVNISPIRSRPALATIQLPIQRVRELFLWG
jgi:hypothetical protein